MKKVIGLFALLVASMVPAFSDCDIQIYMGGQFDVFGEEPNAKDSGYYYYWVDDGNGIAMINPGMTLGLCNHNTWTIKDTFLSVGFMEALDLTFIDEFLFNLMIAPTIGFRAGKVAKFQISPGLFLGTMRVNDDSVNASTNQGTDFFLVGFALDLQARFLSDSPVSPVIGYRYEYSTPENDDYDKTPLHTNKVYLAISFNMGNKKKGGSQKSAHNTNAATSSNNGINNDNGQSNQKNKKSAIFGGPLPRGRGAVRESKSNNTR